jgi:hypothetical protein
MKALAFVIVVTLFPTLVWADDLLPLRQGRYSLSSCDDAANAALLFYDGKSLNGAHSQACTMSVEKKTKTSFVITQKCPAEQVASSVPARPIEITETITVKTNESFQLSTAKSDGPKNYQFCATN